MSNRGADRSIIGVESQVKQGCLDNTSIHYICVGIRDGAIDYVCKQRCNKAGGSNFRLSVYVLDYTIV